ncbi:MAG TPA: hypothetical protein VLH35_07355 [Candidatus Acidoferrales bacterium]|nr:hypothetical protein [Candidatus Acidoferrales bacterium]
MEWKTLIEQNRQEGSENAVQTMEKPVEKAHKARSPEEKMGRIKYNQVLLKRAIGILEKVEETQRVILNGLKGAGYFRFSVPLLQKYACQDQVDADIIDAIKEVGSAGVFPKDVAASLQQYKLEYYDVSRRIVRMNKRLQKETGEELFEKRGHKWALTKFAFDMYGDNV